MNPNDPNSNYPQQGGYPNPNPGAGFVPPNYGNPGAYPPNYPQQPYPPQPPYGYGAPPMPPYGTPSIPDPNAMMQPGVPPMGISEPPVEGNSFVTTDLPKEEETRKQTKNRRMFYVLLGLSFVFIALIVWEIIDIIFRLA